MNLNDWKKLQINLSGIGFWLALFGGIWLLGSVGLGWIVHSILILIVLLAIAPVIFLIALRWWLQRNLIESSCPVCQTSFPALNNTQVRCPGCGEPLKIASGKFTRLTPDGTIDVEAIDVSVQQIDDRGS